MIVIVLAALVILGDQLSKAWVAGFLPLGHSRVIWPGVFALTHIRNAGAAFGMLQFRRWLFITMGLATVAAAVYFRDKLKTQPLLLRIGLGLALGGTVGNMLDRVFIGKVRDFLDFYLWPVFNVADMAIVAGVAAIVLQMLRTKKNPVNGG
ncbi:MAG: signal peptidase II [Patescibacteria group bacterium]